MLAQRAPALEPVRALLLLEAGLHRIRVARKTLGAGEDLNRRRNLREPGTRIVDQLLSPQEGVHSQSSTELGLLAGRQHVVRPGAVVAEADRRALAEKNRARV